jgi:IclR family mhp operon transcriptional activator
VETNSRRASFDDIRARPVSFHVNLLRSASGRAYLAFCPDPEREAVLRRLQERNLPGHELASRPEALQRIVEATRRQGYAVRSADFGGHYSKTRADDDDGRLSIAMPIRLEGRVLGCINLTWRMKVMTVAEMARRHLDDLRGAVAVVEQRAGEVSRGLRDGVGVHEA